MPEGCPLVSLGISSCLDTTLRIIYPEWQPSGCGPSAPGVKATLTPHGLHVFFPGCQIHLYSWSNGEGLVPSRKSMPEELCRRKFTVSIQIWTYSKQEPQTPKSCQSHFFLPAHLERIYGKFHLPTLGTSPLLFPPETTLPTGYLAESMLCVSFPSTWTKLHRENPKLKVKSRYLHL